MIILFLKTIYYSKRIKFYVREKEMENDLLCCIRWRKLQLKLCKMAIVHVNVRTYVCTVDCVSSSITNIAYTHTGGKYIEEKVYVYIR